MWSWVLGHSNWLFAESLRGSQRTAAVVTQALSAKPKVPVAYAYPRDVFSRLPNQKNKAVDELLSTTGSQPIFIDLINSDCANGATTHFARASQAYYRNLTALLHAVIF